MLAILKFWGQGQSHRSGYVFRDDNLNQYIFLSFTLRITHHVMKMHFNAGQKANSQGQGYVYLNICINPAKVTVDFVN